MNLGARPGVPYPDMGYPQAPFNVQQQQQPSKVPPCSTLFVANLHLDVQERDLARLFKITPGFRRLRLSLKDGAAICFVEFDDVQSSTHALTNFQGFPVGTSNIRIEYARTRMGESKRPRTPGEGEEAQNAPATQLPASIDENEGGVDG